MRLQFEIRGRQFSASFTRAGDVVTLATESRVYNGVMSEPQPGLYSVIIDGRVFDCAVEITPGGTDVLVNGRRISVHAEDPRRLGQAGTRVGHAGGKATVTSPMPGKVVQVLCGVGDEVTEGQGLLIVEAMKMQNELLSPKNGRVTDLRATTGQTVNAGELVVVIE